MLKDQPIQYQMLYLGIIKTLLELNGPYLIKELIPQKHYKKQQLFAKTLLLTPKRSFEVKKFFQ